MLSDLRDLEADRKVLAEEPEKDTTFVCKERPCPMPQMCSSDCRVCRVCKRKLGQHPQTKLLKALARMMDGGYRVKRGELAAVQWELLGGMRGRGVPW